MSDLDIVIVTLLGAVGIVSLVSLINRMANLDDKLWIEPLIMSVVGLLIYLVVR